jgi:hypothetical protein
MPLLKPHPTFYPSPKMAMQASPQKLAYVALINPTKAALTPQHPLGARFRAPALMCVPVHAP